MKGFGFNIFGFMMIAGVLLITVGTLGIAFSGMPLLDQLPYIGGDISFVQSNSVTFLTVGIFMFVTGTFMSPILGFVFTLVSYLLLFPLMGIVPPINEILGGLFT